MPLSAGEKVGTYQIIEEIGRGGMAAVYKAYHPALDRFVAIKVMDAEMSKEQGFIDRFKREARVIAKLDNPHIVPVYDYDEYHGQPYLVLKYIDGQTLRDRMKAGTLSTNEVLEYVKSVGDGLQYAHNRGILHRDIKPSNVLTSSDGNTYLTDFGLAKIIKEGISITTGDVILGTPYYISPEQARNAEHLDEGTDIYSFGVMIYEMVVGRVPYESDTPISVIEDHLYTPLPLPTSFQPSVPHEIEQVLLKTLAKERRDRYDTVTNLVKAFQQACKADINRTTGSTPTIKIGSGVASLLTENGQAIHLGSGKVVLGRNSVTKNIQNDIDVTEFDVKKIASRRHAMVQHQTGKFLLYDLNSRNGTFVNGNRISAREPYTLQSGDIVELGSGGAKFVFVK